MARKAKTVNASAPADEPEELLESEELEAADDEEESEEYTAASSDYDDDSGPAVAAVDDHLVDYSVKSREATRAALNAQIEEFLSRGGRINQVDNNVTADPPRKPTSNYGSRPI